MTKYTFDFGILGMNEYLNKILNKNITLNFLNTVHRSRGILSNRKSI